MDDPSPAMEFLGRVAFEAVRIRPLLPTYLHLLVSAMFPIYTGAHASLSRPSSAASPDSKKSSKTGPGDEEDEDDEPIVQKMEGLSPSDALVFPLLAGTTLASLYFLIKWLEDPAILNKILGYYFALIGLTFGMKFLDDAFSVTRSILFPTRYSASGVIWKADNANQCYKASSTKSSATGVHQPSPLPGFLRSVYLPGPVSSWIWKVRTLIYGKATLRLRIRGLITLKAPVDLLDLSSTIVSAILIAYHTLIDKPWGLTNFLGFSFCYGSLQFMSPTTSWTGTLILGALFFYDIYFVFFTPMMVTVAMKLDVPIKLLFPRPNRCVLPVGAVEGSALMEEYLQCLAKKRTMAMLGLGDIVIPGMMIAFALRFDLYLFYLRQKKRPTEEHKKDLASEVATISDSNTSKPTYHIATGGWGERFWTSRRIESIELSAKRFPKTYFYASMIGYLLGLVTTLLVMQVAEHAQPALLYLVPGVLTALWGTASVKGDLRLLWEFSEASEDDGAKAQKTKNDENPESSKAAKSETKSLDKTESKDPAKDVKPTKEESRDLISFSVSLPRTTVKATQNQVGTDSDDITTGLAEAMNGEVGRSSGDAKALLPDIEADNAVIAKLERQLTDHTNAASTGIDAGPPEKRRRKA